MTRQIVFDPYRKARPTRYAGMHYMKLASREWSFVDSYHPQTSDWARVGPLYGSLTELMADMDRYCTEFGLHLRGDAPAPRGGPRELYASSEYANN